MKKLEDKNREESEINFTRWILKILENFNKISYKFILTKKARGDNCRPKGGNERPKGENEQRD